MSEPLLLPDGGFIVFWFFGIAFFLYIAKFQNGWQALATHYRTTQPATGKRWGVQTVIAGWALHSQISLTTNAQGLFVDEFENFPFWKRRCFIPWDDFHDPRLLEWFVLRTLVIQVGYPVITTLCLPPKVIEQSAGWEGIVDRSK